MYGMDRLRMNGITSSSLMISKKFVDVFADGMRDVEGRVVGG
jgi:hypothetical protein